MFDETQPSPACNTRRIGNCPRIFPRAGPATPARARRQPASAGCDRVDEVNLASSQARGAQLLFLVPWLALLGAVAGAISVAIDVTAGERERGSLEPLLMNPVSTGAVVLGKWAVVALCSASVVVLTLIGFMTAMQFVRSENLAALMQFGLDEFALFVVMLLPFSAMIAALNMRRRRTGVVTRKRRPMRPTLRCWSISHRSFRCSYRSVTPAGNCSYPQWRSRQ